ncbi:MAG: MBL fold metallo-hydrolase [archaeon]|nr:MBL fold metallo-hydrolase [archaeon]
MKIAVTWYGCCSCHIVINDNLGLFLDPYFDRLPGAEPVINVDADNVNLDPFNYIIISHSHFDHVYNVHNLIKRYKSVQVYAPDSTKDNSKNLCSGNVLKNYSFDIPDEDFERIHQVTAGDEIDLDSKDGEVKIKAKVITSCHVVFDWGAIHGVLTNKKVYKNAKYYGALGAKFPAKEIIGWNLEISANGETKNMVIFGSLCKSFPEILSQYQGCDYFMIPLHGRKKMMSYASFMTESLKPKTVIPIHNDNAFPPISWYPDISEYKDWLKATYPDTKMIVLEPEKEIEI